MSNSPETKGSDVDRCVKCGHAAGGSYFTGPCVNVGCNCDCEFPTKGSAVEAPEREGLPLTPDKTIELLQQVLEMLEAVSDHRGRMSSEPPLPKARVYLRGIIGRGIADVQAACPEPDNDSSQATHGTKTPTFAPEG